MKNTTIQFQKPNRPESILMVTSKISEIGT